jgi:hypothetical protein
MLLTVPVRADDPGGASFKAKIDGESVFAKVTTQLDAEKNGAALLEKALEGLPLNLLTVTVPDPNPQILQKDDRSVKAQWTVVIGFDYHAYEQKVLPKLREALDASAKRKTDIEFTEKAEPGDPGRAPGASGSSAMALCLWNDDALRVKNDAETRRKAAWGEPLPPPEPVFGYLNSLINLNEQTECLVMLNVGKSPSSNIRRWKWYVLDRPSTASALLTAISWREAVKVTFIGNNGRIIRDEEIELRDVGLFTQLLHFSDKIVKKNTAEISPFIRAGRAGHGLYGNAMEASYQAEFRLEEIKEIREIRCSVVEMVKDWRIVLTENQERLRKALEQWDGRTRKDLEQEREHPFTTLKEERERLEKTQKDLEAKLTSSNASAASIGPASSESALVKRLQRERADLQKKLDDIVRQLAENENKYRAKMALLRLAKLEPYKVLPGDALPRIVLRWNDTLDKRGLPRITQEQVESVNSGMASDRIRPGQVILLPVPEPAQTVE